MFAVVIDARNLAIHGHTEKLNQISTESIFLCCMVDTVLPNSIYFANEACL